MYKKKHGKQGQIAIAPITWKLSALAIAISLSAEVSAQSPVLEEIVVTARKVQENLQETPVAVSAFTEEAMERRMLVTTEDLGRVTPNLQFKSYSPLSGNSSAAQVFIRGIGQSDASGGIDPGVGLYIDDVYMGRAVGGVMDFRDIANVQVLRGPQGTLFGRNTIGGAVLLTTKAPGDELAGKVKLGTGEDGLIEFFGAVDLPLSDNASARVSYGSRERDGYVERQYDGLDLGNEDSYTFNASLHMDLSDSISLIVRGDYTEEDENGSPFVFAAITEGPPAVFAVAASVDAGCPGATFPPPSVPSGTVNQNCANNATWNLGEFTNGGNTDAFSTLENSGISATLSWDLNDAFTFKSITASRNLEWSGARDADNTYLTILSTTYESEASQFSEELQFLYEADSLNGVVGLFYFNEEVDELLRVPFGNPGALLPPPTRAVSWDYQNASIENDNWALFTNWNFDLTDALSLSVGVRYTEEEKSILVVGFTNSVNLTLVNDGNGVFVPEDFPNPTFPAPGTIQPPATDPSRQPTGAPLSGFYNVLPQTFTQDFDATTGSLSLSYDLSEDSMVYVSWSQGFKSGGFNQRFNDLPLNPPPTGPEPTPFESEEAETWELGFKSDLSDTFRLNGAIFTTDYKDMQLTYRVGIVPVLFNAGESTISGAELEFTYVPSAAFILEGSLGYLDDQIDSIDVIPGTTQTLGPNNDLPFTPELSASLGGAYTFDLGSLTLTPRIDIAFTDEQFFDTGNTVQVAQTDAETIVNLSLRLAESGDKWNIVAGIENLTDETYPIAGNSSLTTSTGYAEIIYNRPRNYYLSGTYNF
jgi:iron complex outermembrane receptor protein